MNREDQEPPEFALYALTVDIVAFTLHTDRLKVIVTNHKQPDLTDLSALPGGSVKPNEDLSHAARRQLSAATNIGCTHLSQLGAYESPNHDPHIRGVSVAWWAILPTRPDPAPGIADNIHTVDAIDANKDGLHVAPTQRQIITDAHAALRHELQHSTLAAWFWHSKFRVADLRRVYDAVFDTTLEPGNFQRKVRDRPGFIEPTETHRTVRGRPAQLFRAGPAPAPLSPPLHIPPIPKTAKKEPPMR